jgi:glutathione S-transferase
MPKLRLYDYPASGNCLKVRVLLRHLGRPYERFETDIFAGATLTEEYARKNPARQTPLLEIDGERFLPESNAILWYLAEGSPFLPTSSYERASVVRWLLFEQEYVGQSIANLRFRLQTGRARNGDEYVTSRRQLGRTTLEMLDHHLAAAGFLAGETYTIADIANYSYVHVAGEAGYELRDYHAVNAWLRRIERQRGFHNDLAPLPSTARPGRGLSIYG